MSDSPELLKPNGVTDSELQNELSNLRVENEKLTADYNALLESSSHITNKLRQEAQELRSQLEAERADREGVERELADLKENEVAIDFTGKAGDLLSWLRKTVGKTLPKQVTLAEIKKILEAEA